MSRAKEKAKTRNMNFRETRSERTATNAYRSFHKSIKRFFTDFKEKIK